jgi:hypothetical protein
VLIHSRRHVVKLGDLIARENDFWVVARFDPKRTRTATIRNAAGLALEIPHDATVEVIANPSEDWPFIAAPIKAMWGPITQLTQPNRPEPQALRIFRDWLPSEPARAGGSIFLNPSLRLQHGDYLLATYANGKASSIVIPKHFSTVREKQARAASKAKPDRTVYTRLLDDDPFEDDD